MIIFPMHNSTKLGKSIAHFTLNSELGSLKSALFPDGEFHIQFKDKVKGRIVVLVQALSPNPNTSLLELYFCGKTAKELGAKKVIGVIPYLAYMRQDKRFNEGEALSNKLMGHLIDVGFDKLITVDPHLHRVKSLEDVFSIPAKKLTANSVIAEFIEKKFSPKNTVIVGPDIESSQWAKKIADSVGFESTIFLKNRFSSRKVKVNVTKELEWKGKNVVIIDDIISSGHTMIEAVKEIKKRKPKAVHCICVHGIFAENAYNKLKKAGAKNVISCNSIPHESNKIDLAPLIAKELK